MKSLRRSILMWMASLLLVVGVVSTLATYFYVRSEATGAVDIQLKQIAHFISSSNATGGGAEGAVDAPNPEDMFLIEIWDSKGILIRSSNKTTKLDAPKMTGIAEQSSDGQNFRSYSFISPQNAVRVSLPSDVSDEQATNAAFQVGLPAALIIPLSWLLLSYIIDRIFAPLDLAAKLLRNSAEPVALGQYPSEVAPFISANNELIRKLKKIVDQQNQFVSNAAHELRTPLTAIALQIDNLRKYTTSKALKQRVDSLSAGSKRANQLVNRLLELARLDSCTSAEKSDFVDVAAALESVISRMTPLAKQRKIKIRNQTNGGAKFFAPKLETIGIAEALIENAILYSRRGGVVEVALLANSRTFQLTIKDHGIGISEDKLSHVFERFYRAEPQANEGTGLGLAIAKANADRLGWHITIANRSDCAGIVATLNGKSLEP